MKTTILSLLLALFATAMAGLCIFQLENQQLEANQREATLKKLDKNLNALETDSRSTQTALSNVMDKYQSLTAEGAWKIAEIEHFLRMAAIELQISSNVSTSLRLLEAADNLLSSMPDPKFFPIRDLIAKEMASIQASQLPDLEKLWLQVSALRDQIPKLQSRGIPGANTKNKNKDNNNDNDKQNNQTQDSNTLTLPPDIITEAIHTPETLHPKEPPSDWQKGLESTWHQLKDLIKIQRHSKTLEPILNETEQALAKENLLLMLDQIRWAILNKNNTVYQESISDAKEWLNQYFEPSDSHLQQFQASLNELAKINLRPTLPEIGQSLKALQNIETQNTELKQVKS